MDRVMWRPYKNGDIFSVNIRDGDALLQPLMDYPGTSWTLTPADEDRPLMCCGIMPTMPGIGTIWAFTSDEVRGNAFQVVRFIRRELRRQIYEHSFRRLQAIVRKDRPEYQQFVEMLGFEYEGTMRQAALSGDDILLYSKITPDTQLSPGRKPTEH